MKPTKTIIISSLLATLLTGALAAHAGVTADPFDQKKGEATPVTAKAPADQKSVKVATQAEGKLVVPGFSKEPPITEPAPRPGEERSRERGNMNQFATNADGTPASGSSNGMPPLPVVELTPKQLKDDSFKYNVEQRFPLSPEMIRELRKIVDEQQRVKSENVGPPPKPVSRTVVVLGEPGESPAVIRLARNFLTTLVFSDATGAPWPVKSFGSGNEEQVIMAAPDPETAPNVLTIHTTANYVHGNAQVILAGRTTPIVLTITSDQKSVDYTTNIKLQARGPNAVAPVLSAENYSVQTNPVMVAIVDGIPPKEATPVTSSDPRMQVWKVNKKYYLRTKMTIYSPAWSNHAASPDGMHAYEITPTPVVVAADNGSPHQINIGE